MKRSQAVRVALLLSVAAAVFVGCASPDRQHDSAKRKLDGDPVQVVKRLYLDLLSFKDASGFHKMGFGVASPYHEWLQSVNSIEDNKEFIDTLLPLGVVPGDLTMLGMEYMNSRGKETDYSKFMRGEFEKALKLKDEQTVPNNSPN